MRALFIKISIIFITLHSFLVLFAAPQASARNIFKEFVDGIDWDGEGPQKSKKESAAASQPKPKEGTKAKTKAKQPTLLNAKITVYPDKVKGPVNRLVFGTNLLSYDPHELGFAPAAFPGFKLFGAGVWDPRNKEAVPEVVAMAREAGTSIVRYPGGCGSHHFDWKQTIGERHDYLFGLNEFMRTAEEMNAEAIFTVSYFTGSAEDAADLVEYLNSPHNGSNPNGGTDWAAKRAEHGRTNPYNVKYFEIGNEIYHGDHKNIKEVKGGEYGREFIKYYEKMKAVDPSVQVGAVIHTHSWNKEMMDIVKDKIDFAVFHTYPSPEVDEKALKGWKAKDVFETTFLRPIALDEVYLKKTSQLLREKAGKDVPYAVTEFNTGFIQQSPPFYLYTLGSALLNAQLIEYFMQPKNNVLLANYWNLSNEYFSMLQSKSSYMEEDYRKKISYVKRPTFYVFKLYNEHFGDVMIDAAVESESYLIPDKNFTQIKNFLTGYVEEKKPVLPKVPYVSVNASKSSDGEKLYLMIINRHLDQPLEAKIALDGFTPQGQVKTWVLNGPAVDSHNDTKDTVKIVPGSGTVDGTSLTLRLEPHSLTAVEILSK